MKKFVFCIPILLVSFFSCSNDEVPSTTDAIKGFELLNDLSGHWVGSNQTSFGFYDWFAFDFRPISGSHCHSIYEGGTNQNIITSVFLAEYNGRPQIMARNGGWLGTQYRATYFVLDKEEKNGLSSYYRLVDAVGGVNRSYIEFSFNQDSIFIDAYKDNSGSLDEPIHHMGFAGSNRNPSYALSAKELFNYPQEISEVDLEGQFSDLIDSDSALFLEENSDPFPKSAHGYLSDLTVDFNRDVTSQDESLLFFLSKEEIVNTSGSVDLDHLDNTVIRTISIKAEEESYTTTYLHPDKYYLTVFFDADGNGFPSSGDYTSISTEKVIAAEAKEYAEIKIELLIP